MVLSNMQGWVSRVELPAPDNGLDELRLAKSRFSDRLKLIKRRRVLKSERTEAE